MLTEKELNEIQRKLTKAYNSLIQTSYSEFRRLLAIFLRFIDETPFLVERIKEMGKCDLDLYEQVNNVSQGGTITSLGNDHFNLGSSTEEEIRNVYAILCFIRDNEEVKVETFYGYSSGKRGTLQDNVDGFNRDVVKVFVDDLHEFINEEIEKVKTPFSNALFSIQTSGNSTTNLAVGNSSIVSNNTVNNGIDVELVLKLIGEIRKDSETLDQEVKEELWDALDMIKDDISKQQQTPSIWKVAKRTFERIKTGVDFALALGKLILIAEEVINR